jgi:acyl-coenzyme A thioesterase PaaI-like protein
MTDLSGVGDSVPSRLGVTTRLEGEGLVLELRPQPETLHHGMVRASVLAFVIDVAAGIPLDRDPEVWTLTTDLSVRMRAVPAPGCLEARSTVLRQGRRSATSVVELTTEVGRPVASGAIGFTKVRRRPGDPPKPNVPLGETPLMFRDASRLTRPLREEAGIEVVDAAEGVVRVEVTPELQNPAGTLQGAMVALIAEAAAEDLVATRFGRPVAVLGLDLRYLRRTQAGPVRTQSRLLGSGPGDTVEVALVDTSIGEVTTLAYAGTVPAS